MTERAELFRSVLRNEGMDSSAADVLESRLVEWERSRVPSDARALFSDLKTAVGRYIECDEQPRPVALWTAMCVAQEAAAIYFNTGELSPISDAEVEAAARAIAAKCPRCDADAEEWRRHEHEARAALEAARGETT